MRFWINNDLDHLVWSWHNKIHFWGSMILAAAITLYSALKTAELMNVPVSIVFSILIGFMCAWVIWVLWDVGDGFKPCWKKGLDKPWIIQQLFYSDGFSLQDVFVWDLFGSLIGAWLGIIIYCIITYLI